MVDDHIDPETTYYSSAAPFVTKLCAFDLPSCTWKVENAFINKIEAPALKAAGNEIAMESVDFDTKLVALLGGGTDDREPLESIAELLLKPLVLGVELI